MSNAKFLKEDLIALRKDLGLTQQQMADALDMALRSYQAIESGESEYRFVHRLAAERVALALAVDNNKPTFAPVSVRKDAIDLVHLGRLSGNPEYFDSNGDTLVTKKTSDTKNARFRAAYGVVGELVLIASALDYQLNHALIEVFYLGGSPMLEPVIATMDAARKIEMLRARSKHISQTSWRKPITSYLEKIEEVSKWRNIACHTVLIPDENHGAVFAPAAASKLLKSLKLENEPKAERIPIENMKLAIKVGETALGAGEQLLYNFRRLNLEKEKRDKAKKASAS